MTTATGSPTWRTRSIASTGCGGSFIGEPSFELISQPQGRPPMPSAAMSAPVKIATTPRADAASFVSMLPSPAPACRPMASALLRRTRGSRSSHRVRPRFDREHDVVIPGAAAQIAFEIFADLAFARIGVILHQVERAHHHARRAEAALQRVVVAEGFLHRVQRIAIGDALDRQHVA